MRSTLLCIVLACFLALVAGWSKEDHEIFRIRDELELQEGEGVTFYDFIGVKSSASQKEIQNAFRKKSAQMHPDKAERAFIAKRAAEKSSKGKPQVNKRPSQREIKKAVKEAQDKYSRLTVIKDILTNEGRARYDHFLRNGFPKWRSTGYYYERFRPGVVSVLVGLWVFGAGVVHYGILKLNHKQQKAFFQKTIEKARKDAYGPKSVYLDIPGIDDASETATTTSAAPAAEPEQSGQPEPRNRKERRMMEKMQAKENKNGKPASKKKTAASKPSTPVPDAAPVPKRRVLADNGRKVLLVAKDGSVYLEQENGDGETEEHFLDVNSVREPTFTDTAFVRAPFWAYNFVQSRISGTAEQAE